MKALMMKALMLQEYKKLEIVDIPQPELGPRDLLVSVQACGICGSDIHGFDGSTGRRIPPLVMGHEAAGVVAAVGNEVTRFRVGDRVTFDSTVSCGNCHFCRRGRINLCDNRRVLGVSCGEYRRHGAFAEFVAVPEGICYTLPDAISFDQAALIEAVSVAVHAVNRSQVTMGTQAVVVGSGMIGLLVVQALRWAGCDQVIAVDLEDRKLKLACELGADVGLNPQQVNLVEEVQRRTAGRGADIVCEVVGAKATVKSAIDCARKGGTVTLVGNLSPTVELPLQSVVTRELNLFGSCASSGEYPECIALMERGAIRVDPLITARASLEEGIDWFQRLHQGDPTAMKVLIQPSLGLAKQ